MLINWPENVCNCGDGASWKSKRYYLTVGRFVLETASGTKPLLQISLSLTHSKLKERGKQPVDEWESISFSFSTVNSKKMIRKTDETLLFLRNTMKINLFHSDLKRLRMSCCLGISSMKKKKDCQICRRIYKLSANCSSVFDHFAGLTLEWFSSVI